MAKPFLSDPRQRDLRLARLPAQREGQVFLGKKPSTALAREETVIKV